MGGAFLTQQTTVRGAFVLWYFNLVRCFISGPQDKSTGQINGSDPKTEEILVALAARDRTALLGLNDLPRLSRQQLVLMGPKHLLGAVMVWSPGFILAGSVVP